MRRHRAKGVRPQTEALESRQLLAGIARGVDIDGDRWVLRLVGPGDIAVVNQPDSQNNLVPLGTPSLIESISISGTDPQKSRLVGTVRQASGGDGKIFFAQFNQLGGRSPVFSGSNLGTYAIDMPHFWLGQTSTSSTAADPEMLITYGVATLRFGGADTTFTPPGGTPLNQNGQSDVFNIRLGLPFTWGTSVVVDQVITDAQAGAGTAAATQDGVNFRVHGRLNVFQANQIRGNTQFPSTGLLGGGGTIVLVSNDVTDVVDAVVSSTGDAGDANLPGAIGFLRVGGNATNFSVESSDRISNFYIGGETSNVSMLAPQGSRNVYFGLGMDDVTIRSKFIDSLQANRGAVGSNVTTNDHIGRITIGGDVVNTFVLAGYRQPLDRIFSSQVLPTDDPPAQSTASINNILIGGDIVNSIFAAAVQPFEGQFDVDEALLFPHSHISAKVEGSIDNSDVTPSKPAQAFYAKQVALSHGPVNPPNVPVPPFAHPAKPPSGKRIVPGLLPSTPAKRIK
jgi:hypothetical protein